MPRGPATPCTTFALHAGFDARQWSGDQVIQLGTSLISLGTYTTTLQDTLSFLNGYSTPRTSHSGTYEFYIDDNDKVAVRATTPFTVDASLCNPAFGYTSDVTAVYDGATYYVAPAQDQWARGLVNDEGGEYAGIYVAAAGRYASDPAQDVPTLFRLRGVSYVDTPSQGSLQTAMQPGAGSVRWVVAINDLGHVVIYTVSNMSGAAAISWPDDDFRKRLGFSGDETRQSFTPTASSIVYYWEADYQCPGCWHPSRPADDIAPVTETVAEADSTTDSRMASNYTTTHQRWRLDAYLDGPMDTQDDHLHWHRKCLPLLHRGAKLALYPDRGDVRLYAWRGDYSVEFNAEALGSSAADQGYRGRIQGHMFSGTEYQDRTWPLSLKRRSPMQQIVIQEVPFDGQWGD